MLPTHLGAPYGDVPRGKPIRLATPGLHVQYTHAGDRRINFLSLGFCSQDNYFPRDRKDYESFHSMIDPYSHRPHLDLKKKKKKKKKKN